MQPFSSLNEPNANKKHEKKAKVKNNIWYLSYHLVYHEPRFRNAVDCGTVSLVVLFDIFNNLVHVSKLSVPNIINNTNRYNIHETGCNLIK